MARRKAARRFGKKGSFRGFSRRSSSRSSGSSNSELMTIGIAAAAYGVGRPYLENLVQPVTSKIPIFGDYVDEVALGALGYFAAKGKFGSNKWIKAAGKAMFIVEATRVGSGLGSNLIAKSGSENSNSFIY